MVIERVADGRFAEGKRKRGNPNWVKGHKKVGGRQPGTPNKVPTAVKEWLAKLVDNPDVQAAVEQRIIKGDAVAFFRALDHVLGKPTEKVTHEHGGEFIFRWKK
jgi:hypothetical protein